MDRSDPQNLEDRSDVEVRETDRLIKEKERERVPIRSGVGETDPLFQKDGLGMGCGRKA